MARREYGENCPADVLNGVLRHHRAASSMARARWSIYRGSQKCHVDVVSAPTVRLAASTDHLGLDIGTAEGVLGERIASGPVGFCLGLCLGCLVCRSELDIKIPFVLLLSIM